MEAEFQRISSLAQRDKTQACVEILDRISTTSASVSTDLLRFLDAVLAADFPPIVARPTLSEYIDRLLKVDDRETKKEVLKATLSKISTRSTTYPEQLSNLREAYADLLEQDEEWIEAAQVLNGLVSDSGDRSVEFKLKTYIRIVRLYLEEEDSTSAETYFNRASVISHNTTDLETQLQFKLCQARMLDFNRRFVEAASKYHEISYIAALEEADRLQSLSAAIVCALLAPAGPRRSRILSALYRDERSPETPHFTVLAKMFLDQTIRPAEVEQLAASLMPHQLARLPPTTATIKDDESIQETGKKGPETVLDRAIMEHNILAVSKVYNNITFSGLGHLLGLQSSASEAMARTMIQQGRLHASVDQILRLLIFDGESKDASEGFSNVVAASAGMETAEVPVDESSSSIATKRWDLQIKHILQLAETVASRCEDLMAIKL